MSKNNNNNQNNQTDSTQTTASKFSNYVTNGKYVTVFEGQIVNLKQEFATPTTIQVSFEIIGHPTRVNFILVNYSDPTDTHTFSTLQPVYTLEGLRKNSTYDVTATAVYVSGNTYPIFVKRGLKTINEGPAFDVQYFDITNHTTKLVFSNSFGTPNTVKLTITNVNNLNDTQVIPNFLSGSIIRNLERNALYNVRLDSFFVSSGNNYTYFLPNAIQTLNEDVPIFLQITNIQNNSATIIYDVIGLPTYNILTLTNVNNNADIYVQSNTLEKTVVFRDIGIGQTYTLAITSVYTTGNRFTTTISDAFTTLIEDMVKNISILSTTGNTVYFSFDPAIGNPIQYNVTFTNQNALFPNDIIVQPFSGTIITQGLNVTNLTHNSRYSFTVTSIYADGNRYTTTPITIRTINEGTITAFSIQKIENTAIIINVTNTIGDSLFYEIRARNVNVPTDQILFTIDSTNSTITIPNLTINTTYIISVTSIYTQTNNRYIYIYANPVTTLNEGPSSISSASETTNNSTSLIIQSPYGIPVDYKLIFSSVTPTNEIEIQGNGSNRQTVFITDLIPNTAYNVTIQNRYFNTLYQAYHMYLSTSGFVLYTKAIPDIRSYGIITDSSASLNFVTPIFPVDAYRLIENGITTVVSSSQILLNSDSDPPTSTLIIPDLVANTAYDISFVFYYQDIQTDYTTFFHINTKGPVENIEYLFITDTSANIAFTPPLVVPKNYSYIVTIMNNTRVMYSINSIDTTFIVSGLSPNTIYSLAITSNYTDQNYTKYSMFNTKDKPRNIIVSSITDVSASISFPTLNAAPDLYYLTYNDILIILPNTHFIRDISSVLSAKTYYTLLDLVADSSYSNLSIGAHYNDISYTFVSDIYPTFYTKSVPKNIYIDDITNSRARINITIPTYTIPDYYLLHFQNSSISDISFSSTTFSLVSLTDNRSFIFNIYSVYISDNIQIITNDVSFQTHGTPIIVEYINIYDTYATVKFERVLTVPTKYRISLLDTNTKRTLIHDFYSSDISTNGIINSLYQYTLPINFLTPNSLYNTSLESYYPNGIYTGPVFYLDTKSSPILTNVTSTDISANVYFNYPFVRPDNINYSIYFNNSLLFTKTNTLAYYDPILFNYFTVSNLIQNTNYTVIATSVYTSDVSYNINSVPFTFQTEGPPTNLAVSNRNISNTQFIITFDVPYNTRSYTVYVTKVGTSTVLTYNLVGINVSPYKIIDLEENTQYSVYVTSNYTDHSFSSNIVEVTTIDGLQIENIQEILDTTAQVIINRTAINPDFFSYNIQMEGGALSPTYSVPTFENISETQTLLNISGLSPNTNYVRFSVNTYYSGTDTTLVSNNVPFYTIGISNATNFITDISATFIFPIPYSPPLNYYYRYGTNLNYFQIYVQTVDTNNTFTVSNLFPNTLYDIFTLYMQYNEINNPNNYIIQPLPFITKQIPIIQSTIITDTTITVSFTSILANVSRYTYRLHAENGTLNTVVFTPIKNPNTDLSSFTISNLITNTNYFLFQIDIYYSDINQTFSSINTPFSTFGPVFNPRIALSSDPNRNSLTFYPPRNKPTYYIISNPYDISFANTGPIIVYDTSMTYFGNNYFYEISNVSALKGYTGIDVVPFFSGSGTGIGSTFSNTNLVKNINLRILNGLVDLATNQLGNYISVCEDVNIYVSSNSGNIWTTNTFNTNITKVIMDASGKNQYALYSGNPSFVYVSNNFGSSWVRKSFLQGNRLSTIATDISGQTVFAGGLGGSYNYLSTDFGNTWTIDADTQHSENSIDCVMNDAYIYTINDMNNSIIQISKTLTISSSYISIILPNFIPKFIVSNRENTRLITAGTSGIYVSKDGISWTPTVSSVSRYNWLALKCDTDCIRAIAVTNTGILITEDGGLNWNVILPITTTNTSTTNLKQATISGDGRTIYAYDVNKNFYSYVIPDTKGNVRNVIATTITNTSLNINAFPPFFPPNFSYDISAINTISPNDIVSVSSNTIQNVQIPNLTPDGSYNIVITTNYAYPPQSFINTPFSVYTKNYPSNFQRFGNPTDTSAVFQFQSPKSTPTNYILQDSSGLYQVVNTGELQYTLNGLIANTFYPNFKLSSYYADISTAYPSIESTSFFTRGPIMDISINTLLDISLNLSFRAPPNTTNISSNAYTITAINTVPPLETNIYYSSGNTVNIPLDGLSPDGSYNIIVTTNYENPVQNLSSIVRSTYTKSAPLGVRAESDYTTDTSVLLQFQPPKIQPDYYILDVSNVTIDIPLSAVFLQDGSSSIVYDSFLPNTEYNSNISLISYYTDTNSRLYSIPIPSVITEGPPVINSVALDISNGAILSFTPPFVFPTRVRFQIYDTILNILDYDISQNTTQNIAIPDLSYNITYRVVPSSIYPNKTILGTSTLFSSRSPPLNFQTDINATTDSSVSITFLSPINIPNRYEMTIINDGTRIFSLENTLTSFIIDDLSSNTYYSLALQSIYDIPEYVDTPLRLSTQTIRFYTKGPAKNIVIDSLTDTTTQISFISPNIPPTQFIMVVQNQDPSQSSDSETYLNINSPVQLTGLTPNSTYLITFQSVYVNMISSTSLALITQGSPTILSTDIDVTDQYATIPFLACPNIPNFYELVLKYSNGTLVRTVRNTPAIAGSAFLVQDLSSNTAYSVTISAIYGLANSATIYPSDLVPFNTKSAIINVRTPANTITDTTAIFTFQNAIVIPPNPYRITINNQTNPTIPTVNDPNHIYSVPLTNLTPNTFYTARIYSDFSNCVVSTNVTIATEGVPRDISFNTITDVSANIAFQPCNYIPNKYELVLTKETTETIEIKLIGSKIVSSETVAWTGGIVISSDESSLIVYNVVNSKLFTKSLDSGNTWSASSAFVTTTDTIHAASFTTNGYYVYSSNTGIYYSLNVNGSISWVKSNAPFGSEFRFTILKQNRVGNIAIAISNYVMNPLISTIPITYVYYSTNYGQTWTISNSNSVLPPNVTQLQISADGLNAYLLARNIYKSADSGNTWTNILDIDTNFYEISTINNFHISTDGTFLLVITNTLNTFISLDAGNTFTQTTYTISNAVSSIFTFSMDGKYGYQCNTDGFLYYSTNYGQTWINSLISCTNPTQNTVLLKTTDSGNYAIYSDGISGIKKIYPNPVQTTKSYGVTTLTTKDIKWQDYWKCNIFTYISSNGNFLLLCYEDFYNAFTVKEYYNGFIYSTDFGNTWTEILISIDNQIDNINAFCGNENGYVVYATKQGVYISADFGNTTNLIPTLGTYCKKIAIDETGKYIIAVTQAPTTSTVVVHNSIDYGITWKSTTFSSMYEIFSLSITRDAKYSFFQSPFSVYRSTDYGDTWQLKWNNQNGISVSHVSTFGNFIFLASNTLYTSIDYGETFGPLNTQINQYIYKFLSFSKDGKYGVYPNTDGYLYFSENYGVTWTNSMQYYVPSGFSDYSIFTSKIQMSDDGTFVLGIISTDTTRQNNNIVRIDNITRIIPQSCTFNYNYLMIDSRYSTYLQSVYNAHTPPNIYPSITTDLITKSYPTNIKPSSDFTTVDVTFSPPGLTQPTNYTIYVYDIRYQLYKTGTVQNTDVSGIITDLSINTYYNLNVSSNYATENISIVSPFVNFYTSFNPIIESIFYTINKLNDTFTVTASYRMNKPPLYYLMKIEYPKKYLDAPTNSIIDIENSVIYIYDTNQTNFSFFNLNETGNYIVTVSAVYAEYTFTLDTSTNIYVNTTVPVSFDSYASTNASITVNYTILDPTSGSYYLQLRNTEFPLYYSDISLSNVQSTFTYSGLIPNSGAYKAYISNKVNGGTYNSNRSIITLVYNPPAVSITDISTNRAYNAITSKYSIQNSYNTLYTIVLQNTVFDISFNNRTFYYNTSSTFSNLFYNSGSYSSYIRVKSNNTTYISNIRTVTLPYIKPIAINSVTGGSNSISLAYTLYNTYQSKYQLHIKNTVFPDICFNVPITANSNNYVFTPLTYYNLGSYYVYMDVSYVTDRYFTPLDLSASTIYRVPITIQYFYSNSFNSIGTDFTTLPCYQSNITLMLRNRIIPDVSYTFTNISSNLTNFVFNNLYYNSGTYDISMVMTYIGVNEVTSSIVSTRRFVTGNSNISATLDNVQLINIRTITKTNNSITIPFTLLRPYQPVYTLYARNTAINDLSYAITTLTSTDTSYTFTNLFYNSGTYNIYMSVKYKNGNNVDPTETTSEQLVTLTNVSPILIGAISQTTNSITVPYTFYPVYKGTYAIHARNTSIPALSRSIPLTVPTLSAPLISSYTFADLFVNSGSYNISIDVSYNNNGTSTFTTTPQTITLATVNPVTITAISNTTNTIDVSYSFVNVYNPSYTIYVNNISTPIPALSYSENTLAVSTTHYTLRNLFYNSGTYSVFIVLSYNGSSVFTTPVSPVSATNSTTLPTVTPITLGTITTGVSNNFNTITVPYSLFTPIYGASYTIYATNTSSNPNTPFTDLTTIPGLTNWYDASDLNGNGSIPVNGTTVQTWVDKTTNQNHMIAQLPGTYATNSKNGLGTVTFANSWYRTVTANAPYPLDVYVVVKLNSLTIAVDVIGTGSKTSDSFNSLTFNEYRNNGGSKWHNGSSGFSRTPNAIASTTETSTDFLLMQWSIANNSFYIYRNGVQIMNTNTYNWIQPTDQELRLGSRQFNNSGNLLQGSIAEVACFNHPLETTDRQRVEGYLAWKWGLNTSLQSNHPYYSAAPSIVSGIIPAPSYSFNLNEISTPSSYTFTGIFYNSGNYDISMVLIQNGVVTYSAPSQRVTFSGRMIATINTIATTTNSILITYSILPAYNVIYTLYAIPLDQPVGILQRVLDFTGNHTFSNLLLGSGRYFVYITVTYSPNSQILYSNSSIVTLQAITPITLGTANSTVNSITPTFTLLAVSNPRYTLTITNQSISSYTYSYSFTNSALTNYTFPNLPYNSGNYTITLSMIYNTSSTFSATTQKSVTNYSPVGIISSVTPGFNNLIINYSVVPLINAVCTLNVSGTNYNQIFSLSPTGTSFPVNDLTYDSGTYSIYLSVTYSPGGSYTSPVINSTLPTYNFVNTQNFNGSGSVSIGNDATYGKYYEMLSNGSGIDQQISPPPGSYNFSFYYLTTNVNYSANPVRLNIGLYPNFFNAFGVSPSSRSNNVWYYYSNNVTITPAIFSCYVQMDNGNNGSVTVRVAQFLLRKN